MDQGPHGHDVDILKFFYELTIKRDKLSLISLLKTSETISKKLI
jgi:hypothetical protein